MKKQKDYKNKIAIEIIQIIKESVNNDIFNNNINFSRPKETKKKLYKVYNQVD